MMNCDRYYSDLTILGTLWRNPATTHLLKLSTVWITFLFSSSRSFVWFAYFISDLLLSGTSYEDEVGFLSSPIPLPACFLPTFCIFQKFVQSSYFNWLCSMFACYCHAQWTLTFLNVWSPFFLWHLFGIYQTPSGIFYNTL